MIEPHKSIVEKLTADSGYSGFYYFENLCLFILLRNKKVRLKEVEYEILKNQDVKKVNFHFLTNF